MYGFLDLCDPNFKSLSNLFPLRAKAFCDKNLASSPLDVQIPARSTAWTQCALDSIHKTTIVTVSFKVKHSTTTFNNFGGELSKVIKFGVVSLGNNWAYI